MAAIHDLLAQVQDVALRDRLEQEINRMSKSKKFGLVFEEHLPECTPLYDIPIKRGSTVAKKTGHVSEMYEVIAIKDGIVTCVHKTLNKMEDIPINELVAVAEFGEPIYPCLKLIDSICNAPESDIWHTLIEADNYHALQLLDYLYAGKVDCIYIDPPYNTGAKDWKYNNNYVDSTDLYRHSKWLSFMKRRLVLAKKLLNPDNSVLIVTIDEKEYLHLGCLLEEVFPESTIQMVSITMNHAGTGRKTDFARVNEFAFFVRLGDAIILPEYEYGEEHQSVLWDVLRRSELSNTRDKTKSQFYPIFINKKTGTIDSVGNPLEIDVDIASVTAPKGCVAVFPVRDDGIETMWSCKKEELEKRVEKGYIRVGKYTPEKPQKYSLSYIKTGAISDIETGKAVIEGYAKDGSVKAYYTDKRKKNPPTVIESPLYDARIHGSGILDNIIGRERFSFPKSLYAVKDCLKYVIANNKDAIVLDFFAGSGTTLHAVNLLNAEDGGNRRCIMVTNNEVSEEEARTLSKKGLKPGDSEWENLGIARYVTWPRTVCSIKGNNIKGNPLKGKYQESSLSMADGFKSNAAFFKLEFLDKTEVSLGKQFEKLLPVLWLKSGAFGECPDSCSEIKDMLIFPNNRFAVLLDERLYIDFINEINSRTEIDTLYFVTDSDAGYREMITGLEDKKTYQLYSDYIDTFRINSSRR